MSICPWLDLVTNEIPKKNCFMKFCCKENKLKLIQL